MSFEDQSFLILLVSTWLLWRWLRLHEQSTLRLFVIASIVFYSHHHLELLPILAGYCLVDWWIARKIEHSSRGKSWLILGVCLNLVVLAIAKYLPFVVQSVQSFTGYWLLPATILQPDRWIAPFGISFYAFTGIAYLVEVHRRVTVAEASFLRYTASAVFFPHLVAGPILRPNEFLEKLRPGQLPQQPESPLEAAWLIARGYFKKLVIADPIGIAIDPFFAHVQDETTLGVWALPYVYLYAMQIYFDFSGYTDLARGIGLLFGYRWPENFNLPYLATSITDFWQRWHITLSRFLRDYLYITLGGNRGSKFQTYRNLFLTMLLGGLWHGAAWSFVIWGGLHGTFLIVHRLWRDTKLSQILNRTPMLSSVWKVIAWALTFHAVCFAWCFFRLTEWEQSLVCIQKWVNFDSAKAIPNLQLIIGPLVASMLFYLCTLLAYRRFTTSSDSAFQTGLRFGFIAALLFLSWLLTPTGPRSPFIYFQF